MACETVQLPFLLFLGALPKFLYCKVIGLQAAALLENRGKKVRQKLGIVIFFKTCSSAKSRSVKAFLLHHPIQRVSNECKYLIINYLFL
jgi:hypothetical protein